ncbi:MAG: hypothetical protein KGQ57_10790 [Burkholderiales bacterium]|nr:hypothetical protein [Burkholderiales bacterium]TAM49403.1 MAG: hypothetical protein EPN57_25410 [Paraburkholderia sp.]
MSLAAQSAHYASGGNEAREVGPDHDGDRDDGGSQAIAAASRPVMNANGQMVGGTVNVTA